MSEEKRVISSENEEIAQGKDTAQKSETVQKSEAAQKNETVQKSETVQNKESAQKKETSQIETGKQEASKKQRLEGDAEQDKDSDIDTMSVEELADSNEKPVVTASKKAQDKKNKKKKGNSKAARFWKKRKGLIIFLVIAVIIGVFIYRAKKGAEALAEMMNTPQQEISLIERQDIIAPISTTGTIKAKKTSTLYSALKDTKITNVNYEIGDEVNEGDVVVTFSVENINKSISEIQEDIATSRKREALESESRERTYYFTYGTESYTLSSAQERVDQALKALYEACDGYGDAKRKLQAYEDHSLENWEMQSKENLQALVSQAYQKEQSAQHEYSDAVAALAEANRKAINDLASAENTYETGALSAGDKTKELTRKLESYQESLDDYVVTAPISGIVTKVEVEEGNGFNGGNLMVIQDDKNLVVTTEVDEYDIPTVKEGQEVVIKTDATGDTELTGVVASVAPTATAAASGAAQTSSTSNVTYTVEIDVLTRDERLRIGMSAKVNIVTDRHDDTLVVPYSAINEKEDGSKFINVVDARSEDTGSDSVTTNGITVVGIQNNGNSKKSDKKNIDLPFGNKKAGKDGDGSDMHEIKTREVPVTIGIEGDYYTEIFSDQIKEGMQVVLTQENKSSDEFMQMMMNMGDR